MGFVRNGRGKVGKETYLESHLPTLPTLGARHDAFSVYFEWDDKFGFPGAFYIQNFIKTDEFFLVSVTLEDIPNHGTIHFVCNSWVYITLGNAERIAFSLSSCKLCTYVLSCFKIIQSTMLITFRKSWRQAWSEERRKWGRDNQLFSS